MLRRVLAACLVGAMTFGLLLAADDPAKAPKKKDDATLREEAAIQQERLAEQYKRFEQSLLTLAQRLEHSSKPDDQARAKTLKEAIQEASKVGDPAGALATFQPNGATVTANNAFFQNLGTNGRTCFSCHQPQAG